MPGHSPVDEHRRRLVTPVRLLFAIGEQSTQNQALDLCNPFKFVVRYKALVTAPDRYNVVAPEGELLPLGSCHVIVHLIQSAAASPFVSLPSESYTDSLKFCFYRRADDKLVAECTVRAVVCLRQSPKRASGMWPLPAPSAAAKEIGISSRCKPNPAVPLQLGERTLAAPMPVSNKLAGHATAGRLPSISQPAATAVPSILAVTIGLLSLCVLLFPSEGELAEMAPSLLRPSGMHRQLAAFVLGMVVFAILRW